MPCTTGLSRLNKQIKSNVAAQVGRLEGLECEVDQLQNVLQSVASELESGHQQAQVSLLCTKQQSPGQLYARSCKYVTMEVTEPGSPASEWISECRLVLAWLQQLHSQKLPCCVVTPENCLLSPACVNAPICSKGSCKCSYIVLLRKPCLS